MENQEYRRNVLPKDNLGYATLLSLDQGTSYGSGFRMKYKGVNLLITAKHVLFNDNGELRCQLMNITCPSLIDNSNRLEQSIWEIDMSKMKCVFSKNYDIAAVMLGRNVYVYRDRVSLKGNPDVIKNPSILWAEDGISNLTPGMRNIVSLEVEATRGIDEVMIGNDIYIMGYPVSLGVEGSKSIDFKTPLLRKGIVAGINELESTIIIDCPSYFGNSGGPVIEYGEDGYYRVIGLVSRYIPFVNEWRNVREKYSNKEYTNSGYSVVVPIDHIIKLIEDEFGQEAELSEDDYPDEIKATLDELRKQMSNDGKN